MNWFGWKKLFPILFLKVDHLSFSYHSPFALKVIEHKPYDHKADVFSFGVVLWELLSGKVMLGCSNSFFSRIGDHDCFLNLPLQYNYLMSYQLPYEYLTPLQAAVGVVQKVQYLFCSLVAYVSSGNLSQVDI